MSATNDETNQEDKVGKWIGVDLDGTLAKHTGDPDAPIGEPLQPMLTRVKQWIEDGREVRIFTARAESTLERVKIGQWLENNGLPALAITNRKDWEMQELWDDRAIRVLRNQGDPCSACGSATQFNHCQLTDC